MVKRIRKLNPIEKRVRGMSVLDKNFMLFNKPDSNVSKLIRKQRKK